MKMRFDMKFLFYLFVLVGFSVSTAGPVEDFRRGIELDAPHLVESALKRGVDPNLRDAQGQVALFLALRNDSPKVAVLLAAHPRTDIDAANDKGETPLMMAALRGQLELAQALLKRGAAVNREGWTPLHYAASGPEPKLVQMLLDRGAQIDAPSPNGTTPLMMAARYGAIDSAELLRQRGADIARRNQRGLSAADFARDAGRDTLAARLQPR